MALVHMRDMLRHAYDNQYAVGAFDVINLDMLQGVINAAEACRAPVILGIAEPHFAHFSLETFAPAVEAAAQNSSVPVAVHLDHASHLDTIAAGIHHGCNSLMIDGSNLDLQGNIELTRDAVAIARACGLPVEAELGYVPESGGELVFTTAAEAQGFVRHTEVDFLAVSIGTVHGRFAGKPKLDFTRLRQINDALNIPLVLHGSSGLSDEQFHRLIAGGIAKINYFTALTDRAAHLLRDNAKNGGDDYLNLFSGVRQVVEDEAGRLMRAWGSAGRAAEVLTQCAPWTLVDHDIHFKLPTDDPDEEALIAEKGRQILSRIPGVRHAATAKAIDEHATYPSCWRLQLTSESVIEALHQNSDFQAYTQRYFQNHASSLSALSYRHAAKL